MTFDDRTRDYNALSDHQLLLRIVVETLDRANVPLADIALYLEASVADTIVLLADVDLLSVEQQLSLTALMLFRVPARTIIMDPMGDLCACWAAWVGERLWNHIIERRIAR